MFQTNITYLDDIANQLAAKGQPSPYAVIYSPADTHAAYLDALLTYQTAQGIIYLFCDSRLTGSHIVGMTLDKYQREYTQ